MADRPAILANTLAFFDYPFVVGAIGGLCLSIAVALDTYEPHVKSQRRWLLAASLAACTHSVLGGVLAWATDGRFSYFLVGTSGAFGIWAFARVAGVQRSEVEEW